jgi:hypothetical protein
MASWYGTDLMRMKFSDKADQIAGYASYEYLGTPTCVFFNESHPAKVIATISFDSTYNINTALVDGKERSMRPEEDAVITLRQAAFEIVSTDTLFKHYRDTDLNLVPVIDEKGKRVYVLTGPTQNGVVIFGNDYLLTFDDQNKMLTKKKLHQNIISIRYGQGTGNGEKIVGANHTHLPESGELITATDICTLMLYSRFTGWETHTVVSWKYISMWNCRTNTLIVIPQKELNKSVKQQKDKN